MIELLLVMVIIIGCLAYGLWRRSYMSQVIIVANLLVFIYVFILSRQDYSLFSNVYDNLTFVPARISDIGYAPTIVSSMFMHADILHLIGNMLILYLLGLPLEERIGSKNWMIIYFTTGIVATLCFWLLHMDSRSHLLGASGAIFGIGGAFLILYPRDKIPMLIGPLFTTRAPIWLAVGVMFVLESILVVSAIEDGIAHIAHVGGIICGIVIAPIIVKVRTVQKTSIDYDAMRILGRTDEDKELVDRIEKEGDEEIREAWLDFFFEKVARCPKCKRHVSRAEVIECECGTTVDLRRTGK